MVYMLPKIRHFLSDFLFIIGVVTCMDVINKLLWGIATFFIVGFGIYFTFYFRGVKFHFKKMFSYFQQK